MRRWLLRLLGGIDWVEETEALRRVTAIQAARIAAQERTIRGLRDSERRWRRLFHNATAQIEER